MTKAEWLRISAHISTMWPHQPTLPAAVAESYTLLADLTAEQVRTAVDALHLDGREFAPSAGHIRQKIADLEEPSQVWGEVWSEIQHAISAFGSYYNHEAIPWSTPNVAELVGLKDWGYLCTTTDPQSVVEAQTRELWESLRARRVQNRAYEPLHAAGLRRLVDRKQIAS